MYSIITKPCVILRPVKLYKDAGTLNFVGANPSKWGLDFQKCSEGLNMGLAGSLVIPTKCWDP